MKKHFVIVLLLSILPFGIKAQTEKRLALVVGNSEYGKGNYLANPVHDAEDISAKLQQLGFDAITLLDGTRRDMRDAISSFAEQAKSYDVALFYYAGHGIQTNGENYLVPVDAVLEKEEDIEFDCTSMNLMLRKLDASGCPMKIIILDACRNNPFERSWHRSTSSSGLSFVDAPTGTLISYATSPGRTADDGIGRNSPYTSAFLEALDLILTGYLGESPLRQPLALDVFHAVPEPDRESGEEGRAERRSLNTVEVLLIDIDKSQYRSMHSGIGCILLPGRIVCLYLYDLKSVQGHHIEFSYSLVELRRITRSDYDPAFGNGMLAEYFVLEELQHGGRQGLGYAVYLVEKENALFDTALFHGFIYRNNDLAHGILRDFLFHSVKKLPSDHRKTDGGLTRMMGHGIGYKGYPELCRYLLHNGGLTHTGSSQQKYRALTRYRYHIITSLILFQIQTYCLLDKILCLIDVHNCVTLG